MHKTTAKLISITIMMIVSLCLMTVSSYAYLVLSSSPAVSGVAITVGGSNTIKLAGNISATLESGKTINYPGEFNNVLSFQSGEEISPLRPVSTTDGINWFFPAENLENVYTYNPGIMEQDKKTLRDADEFIHDSTLTYGNITGNTVETANGNYLYLDFWAVSPSQDCMLRVSAGENEGSYVISPPSVEKTDDRYELDIETDKAASYTRVGFLVNEDVQTDNETMQEYVNQTYYNERYKKLKGVYQEKGQDGNTTGDTVFTIYEPNADWHPNLTGSYVYTNLGMKETIIKDGDYSITSPLSRISNIHILGNVKDSLSAQKKSIWSETNGTRDIRAAFDSFLMFMGDAAAEFDEEELLSKFYNNWLNGSYGKYLDIGRFISNTTSLYGASEGEPGGHQYISRNKLAQLEEGGATRDVNIVYLERNVPQRIRMYIYLEGQDVDCIGNKEVSDLIVHIELAGSNQM